ncbi:MAG TPA: YibE/F family protein [Actinomycetes bacterium]
MHSHAHADAAPAAAASRGTRLVLWLLVGPLVAATVVGLLVLRPGADADLGLGALGPTADRENGSIVDVRREPCIGAQPPADGSAAPTCPTARVRLTTGPADGRVVDAIVPEGEGTPTFSPGDDVVVAFIAEAPEGQQYQVVDFQRGKPLVVLAALFAVVVVLAGRWRGVAALVGLGVSGVVLLTFVVPAVLAGESPLLVAVVGSSAIMLVSLFLAHGFTARTAVAVLSTAATLALIGSLAFAVVAVSHFTGLGSEDVAYLRSVHGEIDLRGLLLAGIVIGSLGVLDDMTVTQTSVTWEIAHADRSASARAVYRASSRVGRDHVASIVNTLVLAYAGAALPLLLLFTVSEAHSSDVVTTELVAQEVVRTLVGGIGIVAAAPLTTALATFFAVADRGRPESRGRSSRRMPSRHRSVSDR